MNLYIQNFIYRVLIIIDQIVRLSIEELIDIREELNLIYHSS